MNSNISEILLIKCLEIEKDICEKLSEKFELFYYELYSFENFHYILDFLSKFFNKNTFIIYCSFINSFFLKNNLSIGEEYTRIKIKNKNIILYYLIVSSSSLLIKSIIEKLFGRIKEYLILNKKRNWLKTFQYLEKFNDFYPIIENLAFIFYIKRSQKDIDLLNVPIEKKDKLLIGNFDYLKFSEYLLLIKLFLKFIQLFSYEKNNINIKNISNNYNLSLKIDKYRIQNYSKICSICLNNFTNISTTICGHLFCWKCIIQYLQKNNYCPKCRKLCLPREVILLKNFD